MTIVIALGLWFVVVALTIRLCRHVHECDAELSDLRMGKDTPAWGQERRNSVLSALQTKQRYLGSRKRASIPSREHSPTVSAWG